MVDPSVFFTAQHVKYTRIVYRIVSRNINISQHDHNVNAG